MSMIALLTDFGTTDSYVAQMKGEIAKRCDARLMDISHDIPHHDIYSGAFNLWSIAPHVPRGTIIVGVVDPGVGTDRRGIVLVNSSCILVGPDNGLLMPAAHRCGDFRCFEIDMERFESNKTSGAFHGRDVFGPTAAVIANGLPFEQIGSQIEDMQDLDFGRGIHREGILCGKIVYIDGFGNATTNIHKNLLPAVFGGIRLDVDIEGKDENLPMPLERCYGHVEKGEIVATVGSCDTLEFAVREGSATEMMGLEVGDEIQITMR